MKHFAPAAGLVLVALSAPARAQVAVDMHITMGLPAELPPMVVVQPGVRVVSALDEEVYFIDGWYWVRRGPHWYRARDHRRAWTWVEPRRVPVVLVRIPPGQYRHLDHERWKREHHEWEQERKAERDRYKAEEKAAREEWKREKHKGKHGHGEDN